MLAAGDEELAASTEQGEEEAEGKLEGMENDKGERREEVG